MIDAGRADDLADRRMATTGPRPVFCSLRTFAALPQESRTIGIRSRSPLHCFTTPSRRVRSSRPICGLAPVTALLDVPDALTERQYEPESVYLGRCVPDQLALRMRRAHIIDKLQLEPGPDMDAADVAALRRRARQRLDLLERLAGRRGEARIAPRALADPRHRSGRARRPSGRPRDPPQRVAGVRRPRGDRRRPARQGRRVHPRHPRRRLRPDDRPRGPRRRRDAALPADAPDRLRPLTRFHAILVR